MANALGRYRKLRDQLDRAVAGLETAHAGKLVCVPGCCSCCTNLSVFSVEFEAIQQDLKLAGITELAFDADASCGFLKNGLCSIYDFRPIICRTHGLPLVFLNEDLDTPEYNVTFCPKNFSATDDVEFGSENTLDLDELNAELALIQQRYTKEMVVQEYLMGRVELRRLCH